MKHDKKLSTNTASAEGEGMDTVLMIMAGALMLIGMASLVMVGLYVLAMLAIKFVSWLHT